MQAQSFGGAAEPTRFVTGVDHTQFGQIFLLLASLRRNSPACALLVCDLGLSEPQRLFLRRKGILLEIPPDLPSPRHPWDYKAALGRYLAAFGEQPVVWIDVDMIALGDLSAPIAELLAGMAERGEQVAATSSIGAETIARQLAIDPAPHYARLVAAYDPDASYLNSGFFVCRSRGFLQRWSEICASMPYEKLFEQNAFNLAALEAGQAVRVLDPLVWNLCAHAVPLTQVKPLAAGITVTNVAGPTHMLHATSIDRQRDLLSAQLEVTVEGTIFRPALRLIREPEILLRYQLELIVEAVSADLQLLVESGLTG